MPDTAAPQAPTRTKNPRYDVFEVVTVDNPSAAASDDAPTLEVLLPIGSDIAATTDKDAIREAVKDRPAEAQGGRFMVALAGQLRERRRTVKVEPVDDWN